MKKTQKQEVKDYVNDVLTTTNKKSFYLVDEVSKFIPYGYNYHFSYTGKIMCDEMEKKGYVYTRLGEVRERLPELSKINGNKRIFISR